jgi:hypothetical protein
MVRVIDIITAADTADQGSVVYTRLREELARADAQVTVSFEGVQTATSSFVNVAFVQLLSDFPMADIRHRLRVVESTRQINEMIRTQMEREAAAHAA